MDIITIKDLSFSYPDSGKETLSHVDMTIQEGTFNVLCGKSGCGKSTLLRQLKSVLAPHGEKSGEIYYRGAPLSAVGQRVQSQEIGYVLQNPENQIVTDKVWHELAFGLESLGYDGEVIRLRVAEMASYFGIHQWFYRNVSELSGGQKQLLNLASVMSMHPRLLILDEPTSQLDPIAASDFLETVKKINRDIGTTVVLTEHRLQDVIPWADKVFVMDQGRLAVEGPPREIGEKLKAAGSGMFLAMPVPMQVYAAVDSQEACPLTVSEGRQWISGLMNHMPVESLKVPRPLQDPEEENTGAKKEKKRFQKVRKAAESVKAAAKKKEEKKNLAIQVDEAWFRYEKEGRDVVRDLSLEVKRGEFYALVGGNGTGKSTALSLISRVRSPHRGKILLEGKDIRKYSDRELYRGCLGVLSQNPQSMFIKKTAREDLYSIIGGRKEKKSEEYTADMEKARAVEGIVSLTNLEGLLDRHPYDLSGGEQQRLALAKVLLLRPRILLLDEATKGMDAEYKEELGGILKKLQSHGVTILMISHDVEFVAEYADRVGLFFEGNVVACRPARAFFAGNNFYTTAANRMARHYFPDAVTAKEVAGCLQANL